MAIYRTISMSFWTDSKVADDFTPEDRYFYLYLFTNPHTNLCGCYEISIKQAVTETGYSKDTIENLLERFEEYHNVIRYSPTTKEVLLLNWHKYNWTKSEKFRKPLLAEIGKVKNIHFKKYLSEIAYSEDDGYGIDTTCIDTSVTVTDTVTVSNSVNKRGVQGGDTVKESNLSEPVKEKVLDFLAYRQEIKKPYKSERSIKSLITQIEKQEQAIGSTAVISVIDTSMQNGWQGLFWDKAPKQHEMSTAEAARYIDSGGTFFEGFG